MSKCLHPYEKIYQTPKLNDGTYQCAGCGKILIPNGWLESQKSYPLNSTNGSNGEQNCNTGLIGRVTRLEILATLDDVRDELDSAMSRFPAMNSAHEGYSVLQEECQELWKRVCENQKARNLSDMRKEAVQVAAMAVRFVVDVCNEGRGRR